MTTILRMIAPAAFVAALIAPAAGLDPATRCQTAKLKAAGKYGFCRLKAEAKGVKTGNPVDYGLCDAKLIAKFQTAELAAGLGVCPTESDEAAIRAQAAADANNRTRQLSGQRFIDNGDLTVTDTQTGLQWEQKDTTDGSVHFVGEPYSLSEDDDDNDPTDPDGTAYTVFLAALNNCQSADGTTATGGFAGHCDWRLPTNAELQTILLAPDPCGGVHPCIDPIFGPTPLYFTWSVTNHATFGPENAWGVDFYDGRIDWGGKPSGNYVRAVRRAW